jgi:dTDP-glucose pyrophosphorylase
VSFDKRMTVGPGTTIRDALRRLDENGNKMVFVTDEGDRLLGVLSDGDARRIILSGKDINATLEGNFNDKPVALTDAEYTLALAREMLLAKRLTCIPIVDVQNRLVDFVTWDQLSSESGMPALARKNTQVDVPVVIMAGGKGTRLAPFTNVLPKPLIPIGEKTILELIADEFFANGVRLFYITLNYRGEMIKAYVSSIVKSYRVEYVWEEDYCGTAGSLRFLPEATPKTFIVSNCDVLVRADYSDILNFHRTQEAKLTIVSSIQHVKVPYGVVDFANGGRVSGIREKPEFSMPVNTGVYVLEKDCLKLIPAGRLYHMTDLVADLLRRGEIVTTYPVNERQFADVGQWDEFRATVERMKT